MNPCKECIVDMMCTKKCPLFEIDLQRLQTDEEIYLIRCMNNIKFKTYKISVNIEVEICDHLVKWYKNGQWHRSNDQPAVIFFGGTRQWYKNGQFHRDNDQPAITYPNGTKEWYKNGKRHRDNNLHASIYPNGTRYWYKNGVQYEPL